MDSYRYINAKQFPLSPSFYDELTRYIEDANISLIFNEPMPDPKPCLDGLPYAWASEDGVAISLRSGVDMPGLTPRIFDTPIALVLFLIVGTVHASLGFDPVRKDQPGGGQLYPRIQMGKGLGRNFKVGRITLNTPTRMNSRTGADHYDCRARNLFIAKPEDHHRDPYQAGHHMLVVRALERFDEFYERGTFEPPISRQKFKSLIEDLLKIHVLQERGRSALQPA